jgi:hypothetical protein
VPDQESLVLPASSPKGYHVPLPGARVNYPVLYPVTLQGMSIATYHSPPARCEPHFPLGQNMIATAAAKRTQKVQGLLMMSISSFSIKVINTCQEYKQQG